MSRWRLFGGLVACNQAKTAHFFYTPTDIGKQVLEQFRTVGFLGMIVDHNALRRIAGLDIGNRGISTGRVFFVAGYYRDFVAGYFFLLEKIVEQDLLGDFF